MIVKKLTIPFIKDNILKEARKCWIATAAISQPGYNFIFSRLPDTCQCEIITGLHLPTSPKVLREVLTRPKSQIHMKIYSQNFFHPKVYIFETLKNLYAFVGSSNFTMGGFQQNEELSFLISSSADVESLREWFYEYFDTAKTLTEEIVTEYEKIYPRLIKNFSENKDEMERFKRNISGDLNFDEINFTNQYFVKSDYLTFAHEKVALKTPEIIEERNKIVKKLLNLHIKLKDQFLKKWDLNEHPSFANIVSGFDIIYQPDNKVRALWIGYGRKKGELLKYPVDDPKPMNFIRLQVIIRITGIGVWLMPGKDGGSQEDREYFRSKMVRSENKKEFFKLIKDLGNDYWIEVAGNKIMTSEFKNAEELRLHTLNDDWQYYYFTIGRDFLPGNNLLASNRIVDTIISEFKMLYPLYRFMKDKSFE